LPAREYCVQYRETDWDFVSRLLEEEGIFYFFEQKDKETVLVMGDSVDAIVAIGKPEKIPFREPSATGAAKEAVYEFRYAQELKSGKLTLKDYNFTRPDVPIEGEAKTQRDDKLEIYDYPGYYVVAESGGLSDSEKFKSGDLTSLGKDIAQIRLEEEQATRCRAEGLALCRRFLPGFFFELSDHSRFGGKYLLTSVTHTGSQPAVPAAGAPKVTYQNEFSCIPKDVVFRPVRVTPKPVVKGVQNAWVTGPKGEEIYTDSYGRVKVQFPWDRQGKKDDKTSCWVRVSTSWAGKGWGSMHIPRVGWEVLVDFIEGDPDRPIIVGSVYNATHLPPYKLPDSKTVSGLKSSSSKGGDGFNEIRIEDAKGKEQIFVHGEKDLDVRIKNDRKEWIGRNRHLIVKQDKFEQVGNKRHETVDSDHLEKIKGDRNLTVGGKEAVKVEGSHSLTVQGDVIEVFKANHSEETSNDYYLKADNIVIEADTNVTIKVGGSHIAIEAGGIKIGTDGQLKIESAGPLKVESKATADIDASQTSIKGKGMVQIQGALVKLN
ncbi:MAG: type VI secretion system Vgr family protein, partial [Candidatus Zixiibacteriota bacterium]